MWMGSGIGEAALVFLAGAGACLLVGRIVIKQLAKVQCVAPVRYEDCPPLLAYQKKKPKVPTMGGLFVLASAGAVAVFFGGLRHRDGWLVLAAITGLGTMGLLDDLLKFRGKNALGLRSFPKLFVSLFIGAGLGVAMAMKPQADRMLEMPGLSQSMDIGLAWIPLAMFVVAGCSHAVNLTDGMDGLAAGCLAIAFAAIGFWISGAEGHDRALVSWCAALAGACVGFLWFNSFPASIYLGDVGALGLGAALASLSIFSHTALWLALIGGVFVVEALSVMLQVGSYKWRNKKRIFRVAPIHHHFHLGGIAEPKLIVRFWIVGVLLALLSLTAKAR